MQRILSLSSFILHVLIVVGAWSGPFLVSWYILIPIYLIVQIQFGIFGRCLMNKSHGLHENGSDTMYSIILEVLGFHPDKEVLHFLVRNVFNYCLATFAILWQLILGFEPLWF